MTARRFSTGARTNASGRTGAPSRPMPARVLRLGVGLLAGAAVVALSLVSSRSLQAQEPTPSPTPSTVLRISPTAQTVSAGSDVVVEVLVDGVADASGLGAYELTLAFNPGALSFISFSSGPFLGSTERSVTCLPPSLDVDGDTTVDPGFVRLGCLTTGLSDGPTGSGLLATVTLGTSCAGGSGLGFAMVGLSDPLGADIPARTLGGRAIVSGGPPCPTPAPTSTPPPAGPVGDVSCDGNVNSIDAALMLQLEAGLLSVLPCPQNADVNEDGAVNSIDAALILQLDAGLIGSLPPP